MRKLCNGKCLRFRARHVLIVSPPRPIGTAGTNPKFKVLGSALKCVLAVLGWNRPFVRGHSNDGRSGTPEKWSVQRIRMIAQLCIGRCYEDLTFASKMPCARVRNAISPIRCVSKFLARGQNGILNPIMRSAYMSRPEGLEVAVPASRLRAMKDIKIRAYHPKSDPLFCQKAFALFFYPHSPRIFQLPQHSFTNPPTFLSEPVRYLT